jgi:DNA integrity scanning protein DisA with diadenylate cyclase activity
VSQSRLNDPQTPIENQVKLAEPVPLAEPWLQHFTGLAKSDGAVILNNRLEVCQFRARLKPANICLLPDQDDLGSGMRHQVTREFSAYAPDVLGVCVSQDSYISLYRYGKLVSRLY